MVDIQDRIPPEELDFVRSIDGMQDLLDITVTPLSSACGAQIGGVDLTRPLSSDFLMWDNRCTVEGGALQE
jgi:hypothetical protein